FGVVRGLAEQRLPHVFRGGPEPTVLDALAVVVTQAGVALTHVVVDGQGVARRVGDGADDMPRGVEADPLVMDAGWLHRIAGRDPNRVGDSPAEPRPSQGRHENQAGCFLLSGFRPLRQSFADRGQSFLPKWASSRDAGLRPRVVDPT